MALTSIQRDIMACLAANRSDTSYIAGGVALNRDWPRLSDDIDVFHDTDEEIKESADKDIQSLRDADFRVVIDVAVYGIVEATVLRDFEQTVIQWMSESRRRFLPLVRDEEWGSRLHQADLAVNKVLAASTRHKARDIVDLVAISKLYCPLGPVILAASGKPPFYSPIKAVEEIRRHGQSIWDEDFKSVKGIPPDWMPTFIREQLVIALDEARRYLERAPGEIVGCLALDAHGVPTEIGDLADATIMLRRPTEEPELIPDFKDAKRNWQRGSP